MKTIHSIKSLPTGASLFLQFVLILFAAIFNSGTALAQEKTDNKLDDTFLKNLQFRAIARPSWAGA